MRKRLAYSLKGGLVAVAVLLMSGCFAGKSLPQQSYLLRNKQQYRLCSDTPRKNIDVVSFAIMPPFSTQQFVYRLNNLQWQTDYYNMFFTPLDVQMTKMTVQSLKSSQCWKAVGNEWQPMLQSNYALTGVIEAVYADYSNRLSPKAVMTVSYQLHKLPENKVVWQKTYDQRIPLREKSTQALLAAWDIEANRMIASMLREIRPYH